MLIGRLLTRKMLRARGITLNEMAFGATRTGKPYVVRTLSSSVHELTSTSPPLCDLYTWY